MIAVPVFKMNGQRTGEMQVDPKVLGGRVRYELLKQAIVAYLDHQRQQSARTKRRSDVEGSTRKLYRQKGTGNARAGMIRTPVRRGGGRTFGKRVPGGQKDISKKMRRGALESAVLAKLRGEGVLIVEDLAFHEPKTSAFAQMLSALDLGRGCVVALAGHDRNTYLSGRNIPRTEIRSVDELNAYDVMRRNKLLFSKAAFERFTQARDGGVQG
jgi:large subunit ribosomal protein L4